MESEMTLSYFRSSHDGLVHVPTRSFEVDGGEDVDGGVDVGSAVDVGSGVNVIALGPSGT